MSYLTRCNFCTLRDLKQFASQHGQELILQHAPCPDDEWQGRINDGIRPKGTEVIIGGAFAAWLWEIPDHCVCYE